MKKDRINYQVYLYMLVPVLYIALLIAPYLDKGIFELFMNVDEIISHPFRIGWCSNTLKSIAICMIIYGISIGMITSNTKNYRRTEEYGSARWANNAKVNKKYADPDGFSNKILSQNVSMGMDCYKHRRNLNTLVIGGSGAGKSRFYAKPNAMQANTSLVITDP